VRHNPICQCAECFARVLAGQAIPLPPELPELQPELPLALAGPAVPIDPDGDGKPGWAAFAATLDEAIAGAPKVKIVADPAPLPAEVANGTVLGSTLIKEGTTHALVIYDDRTRKSWALWWERNATTSGIGEWAAAEVEW
jgi:hypothetical protein